MFNPLVSAPMLQEFAGSLDVWPKNILAFYAPIDKESLREGMSNIYAARMQDGSDKGKRGIDYREELVSLGTLTSVSHTEDNDNYKQTYVEAYHPGKDARNVQTSFYTPVINDGGARYTYFFQRHEWIRITAEMFYGMSRNDLKNRTVRLDIKTQTGHTTAVFHDVNNDNYAFVKSYVDMNDDQSAVYLLVPESVKTKRAAEDIPPMPGEKPKPQPSPEGQPAPGGDDKPDIPPMPGEGRGVSVTNKDKEGPTVELEAGWWGTKNGEGK